MFCDNSEFFSSNISLNSFEILLFIQFTPLQIIFLKIGKENFHLRNRLIKMNILQYQENHLNMNIQKFWLCHISKSVASIKLLIFDS